MQAVNSGLWILSATATVGELGGPVGLSNGSFIGDLVSLPL